MASFSAVSTAFLLLAVPALATASPCDNVRGDINLDGEADVFDVQCHALYSIWDLSGQMGDIPACASHGESEVDSNCDGSSNVTDLMLTIHAALSLPWAISIDGDQDACVDTCETIAFGCEPGFMNEDCATGIGSCAFDPCQNGGVCSDVNGGFQCHCEGTGHAGPVCEN